MNFTRHRDVKCRQHAILALGNLCANPSHVKQLLETKCTYALVSFSFPLLEGMNDDYIMTNYNNVELHRQRARTNDTFIRFFGGWTCNNRESLLWSSITLEFSREHGFIVVYQYGNNWLPEIFDHARQHSDKSKRPTSLGEVTVQHVLMYRVSRANAANVLARSIDPSKQNRLTSSQIAMGNAASALARSPWSIEEKEMFTMELDFMDLAVGPKLQLLFQGKTLFRSEASGKT
jgi:hypothetical protein